MILEFNSGDAITVFPSLAIQFDVKAGATWFNDPDQEEEYDFSYNYDGDHPLQLLSEMEDRGCVNIVAVTDHNGIDVEFHYKNGMLTMHSCDYRKIMKKITKDLIAGLDKDFDTVYSELNELKKNNNMTLDELENLCWGNSVAVFDLIN